MILICINVKYHFLRDAAECNIITVNYILAEDMVADVLTKPEGSVKYEKFSKGSGLK